MLFGFFGANETLFFFGLYPGNSQEEALEVFCADVGMSKKATAKSVGILSLKDTIINVGLDILPSGCVYLDPYRSFQTIGRISNEGEFLFELDDWTGKECFKGCPQPTEEERLVVCAALVRMLEKSEQFYQSRMPNVQRFYQKHKERTA